MACSVALSESQKALLAVRLIDTDFGDQLYDYYQGKGDAPDISLLVRDLNDKIIPKYFKDFKVSDLKDFFDEPRNRMAVSTAIGDAMFKIEGTKLKSVLDHPSYYGEIGQIIDTLREDSLAKQRSEQKDLAEQVVSQEQLDSSSEGLGEIPTYTTYFNQEQYANVQAYRESRFRGSSATETLLLSKFINDALLRNTFIDTSLGKGKGLVSQIQEPGKPSEIDTNLKNYRKNLLKDLIARTSLKREVDGVARPVVYEDSLFARVNFEPILNLLEDTVTNVKYKGEPASLKTDGVLSEIVNEYKKSSDPELKKIVDNYVDYLILSDFDKLFDYYGQGSIHINKYNDGFDASTRKYSVQNVTSVEAINATWKEQIQDGINFSSDLYKTLISVTPQISFTTGLSTGEYLYPTLVSEVFSRYYDQIDFENTHESLKDIMLRNLRDPANSLMNKNTLYTIYKRFFEEEADNFPEQPNKEIASFANTLSGYNDDSLLRLISMPIEQTPKVFYAEASEVNRQLAIVIANTRGNTASLKIIRDELFRNLNLKDEKLSSLIENYNIKFDGDTVTYTAKGDETGEKYTLTPDGAKVYDMAAITDLSRDMLGLDFVDNKAHKEFRYELEARSGNVDGKIANSYLVFLYDAMKVIEARKDLATPEIAEEISGQQLQSNPTNSILKGLVESGKMNYRELQDTIIPIDNPNSTNVFDMLYQAENRYTGNRLRSTVMTLENTTVAGFSVPTYFLTLKNNHARLRRTIDSVKGEALNKQTLSGNMFINDGKLLERFHVRGAVKVGQLVKGNSSLTELETLTYNLNLGYFDLLHRAVKSRTPVQAMFDITTYSDKTTNLLPLINNTYSPKLGDAVNLFVSNGVAVDETVTRDLHFSTNADFYRKHVNNIVDTWRQIYTAAGKADVFEAAVKVEMKPSKKLEALNNLNPSFFQSEGLAHGLKGFQAARFYAAQAGVTLSNWVHYQNNEKSMSPDTPLLVKPELISYVKLFDTNSKDAYIKHMNDHMVTMANRMLQLGYRLNGPAADAIAKLYPSMPLYFKHPTDGFLVKASYASKIASVEDINPAIRKYFWDFNLVAENLMNSSLGPIYSHKGKGEFGMWVTQVKRNVAATASIRKYALGMEKGVENHTRVAFVDDLTAKLKTILADDQTVVEMDGAALETYTQRLKTWNSLNAKFNGNGGLDHKPFFSHIDPNTGAFHEEKLATFTMDNEMIRHSIGSDVDLYELHKQLYSTDVSKVDITKSWKDGVDLSNLKDHYYWQKEYDFDNDVAGHIFKVESIQYSGKDLFGDSLYTITKRNLTLDPSTPVAHTNQHIRTFFDLWRELGSIDSVERSPLRTSIATKDGDETTYYKPSHTASEKLLDYESYIGKPGESMLPADRIRRNRTSDAEAWNEYKKLFDTDGVVNSHFQLLQEAATMDAGSIDHITDLTDKLREHDVKAGAFEFIQSAVKNKGLFEGFFKGIQDPKDPSKFRGASTPYQRFKGKNIDRVAYAGAVKVGQFNMNDTSTVSKSERANFHAANPHITENTRVDGVTHLITHQISNFNAGIQLNAWHEADEAEVTAPTQMLNALGFRSFTLDDAKEVYEAMGNLVFQSLDYPLANNDTGIERLVNIPGLVSGLGEAGTASYAKNKDQLLRVFKDLLDKRIKSEDDFTLERLITQTFNHLNIPIDDPHVFSAAVAELTNYFTKNSIRTNFDGIFSVLTPSSRMMQFHDVKGGLLPIKTEHGLVYKHLPTDSVTSLARPDYENWVKVQAHVKANPDQHQYFDEAVNDFLPPSKGIDLSKGKPRDLKGQQVVITYADGHEQALSILRSGQQHLIPEAEALSSITELIADAKKSVLRSPDFAGANSEQKIQMFKDGFENFKKLHDQLVISDPRVRHTMESFLTSYAASHPGYQPKLHILDDLYNEFSKTKHYRENLERNLRGKGQMNKLVMSAQYEYYEKLDMANKLYLSRLQEFLNQASNEGHIPLSLQQAHLFQPEGNRSFEGAKISVSRAECIAPLTAKSSFKIREGDTIHDIDEEFFSQRLAEDLDYLDVDADYALVSNFGKKLFVHNGPKPKSIPRSVNVTTLDGKQWYTDESGNRIFQIPKGVTIATIGGALHMYTNGKYDMSADNAIVRSLNSGFREGGKANEHGVTERERFRVEALGGTEEDKQARRERAQVQIDQDAREMYASWQQYLETIGTRIPGQHFQSFQGMKIVGFTQGNKIYTPNEVELLSGSDFDIDKQNVIYYSVNDNGKIALWHPASNMDNIENLKKSLRLPMQSKKAREEFIAAKDPEGKLLDRVMQIDDSTDMYNLDSLLHIYDGLRRGLRLDADLNPNVVAKLVEFENARNFGGIKAVKNFAVYKANSIIHTPSNFTLLSKPVSLDTPAMFAENSDKAAQARQGRRENPASIVDQKLSNMVGKKVIGIMAAGGLKTYSAINFAFNNNLKLAERLVDHYEQLNSRLTALKAEAIPNTPLIEEYTEKVGEIRDKLHNDVYRPLSMGSTLETFNVDLNNEGLEGPANVNYANLSAATIKSFLEYKGFNLEDKSAPLAHPGVVNAFMTGNPEVLKSYLTLKTAFEDDAADLHSQLLSAATDNAKELILNKINATPDLAGVYASLIMFGVPFEEIVNITNSKTMDFLIGRGTPNVFDENTANNNISNLVLSLKKAFDIMNDSSASEAKQKQLRAIGKDLAEKYNIMVANGDIVDTLTHSRYDGGEIDTISSVLQIGDELRTLGRALSINQGVKSNTWDLYSFRKTIENYVSRVTSTPDEPRTFVLKDFIDSMNSNTDQHKQEIAALDSRKSAINILHTLASTPHFAKQLTAYNAASTILELSSYKVKAMYKIEQALKDVGVLGVTSKLSKTQFSEIEKFVDNSIIESFIYKEERENDNPATRPVFYDGNTRMDLDSREGQRAFADWFRDVLIPRMKDDPRLRGNDFMQSLSPKDKFDILLNEPYATTSLKMDTTNVKSIQQQEYRDAYVYNLKQIYDRQITDAKSDTEPGKENHLFNALFWYNLIVNKNNITRNSYALLLGEVMKLDADRDNPYRRLLELKGNIGKSDDEGLESGRLIVSTNGMSFDLLDLLANYNFGERKEVGGRRSSEFEYEVGEEGYANEEQEQPEEQEQEEQESYGGEDFEGFNEYGDDEFAANYVPRVGKAKITKTITYGERGTNVHVSLDDGKFEHKTFITEPYQLIPHGGENRNKGVYISDYAPLDIKTSTLSDTDAVNWQKVLSMTMHQLLSNLSEDVDVQIIQKDSKGQEKISIFDPTKEYHCL